MKPLTKPINPKLNSQQQQQDEHEYDEMKRFRSVPALRTTNSRTPGHYSTQTSNSSSVGMMMMAGGRGGGGGGAGGGVGGGGGYGGSARESDGMAAFQEYQGGLMNRKRTSVGAASSSEGGGKASPSNNSYSTLQGLLMRMFTFGVFSQSLFFTLTLLLNCLFHLALDHSACLFLTFFSKL